MDADDRRFSCAGTSDVVICVRTEQAMSRCVLQGDPRGLVSLAYIILTCVCGVVRREFVGVLRFAGHVETTQTDCASMLALLAGFGLGGLCLV